MFLVEEQVALEGELLVGCREDEVAAPILFERERGRERRVAGSEDGGAVQGLDGIQPFEDAFYVRCRASILLDRVLESDI